VESSWRRGRVPLLADDKVKSLLDGKQVNKVIIVPRKLVNIVVAE
jgi:leucyl-tRNA synthetase